MAEIDKKHILKDGVQLVPVKDYAELLGVKPQALQYAIDKDKVDFVKFGFERLIVMTDKTREYSPHQ